MHYKSELTINILINMTLCTVCDIDIIPDNHDNMGFVFRTVYYIVLLVSVMISVSIISNA